MPRLAYCENGDCRVELFRTVIEHNDDENQNCPECGRFGRIKDEPKEQS